MYLLAWIFIGVLIGWGAGRSPEGNSYGPFMDLVMGVAGAVAGGFLMRSAGYGGAIVTSLFAVIGAVLLTMLVGLGNQRRVYARGKS
jgi:uncharacterized membrane protein YeaQ/YmgE (transglycosylase-associated protein family)